MTQEFNQLFYLSHADLCEAAATTPLEDAQAGLEHAHTVAEKAQTLSDETNAKLAKMNAGAAGLAEQVNALRDEDTREFNDLSERALTGADVDLESESNTSAQRRNLLTQLRDILERAHAVIIPRERLAALLNGAVLLSARANVSSYIALELGIARYEASKPLLAKDGSVTFSEAGACWEAYTNSMHAHRLATEAVAVVEAEQHRQRMIAAQGVL